MDDGGSTRCTARFGNLNEVMPALVLRHTVVCVQNFCHNLNFKAFNSLLVIEGDDVGENNVVKNLIIFFATQCISKN